MQGVPLNDLFGHDCKLRMLRANANWEVSKQTDEGFGGGDTVVNTTAERCSVTAKQAR